MKNEIYLWVALIVVIIAVALYIRFDYGPSISMKVGLTKYGTATAAVYPEQELFFNVSINNTGSSPINQLGIDMLVNGNITNVYDASVPPGRVGYASINYTPPASGVYNVTVIADPGKLYNINDRQNTVATLVFTVSQLQKPQAYLLLPEGSASSVSTQNLNTLGFAWYSFLNSNYNISRFNVTGLPGLAGFRTALDYVGSYIENMSMAHAVYKNGSSVYSIWMNPGSYRNILPSNIIGISAEGINLTVHNETVGNISVTLVHLKDNESLCSWNSGGWIKMVASEGNGTCIGMVNDNSTMFSPKPIPGVKLVPPLISGFVIANDTVVSGNIMSESYSAIFNQSIDFASVTEDLGTNSTCFGEISAVNNVSYCSSFVFPVNGTEKPPYLIRTRANVGNYNLTLLWRTNYSLITSLVPKEISVLEGYNAIGSSVAFSNGIPPQCSIDKFGCGNATYTDGVIRFRLLNLNATSPVRLDSIGCVFLGATVPTTLNMTLPALGIANVSTTCYNQGKVATSLLTGMAFTLRLNYTESNTIHSVNGTAYVLG